MPWITEEEGSHFHFNCISKSTALSSQFIVLKQKTSWKESEIQGVVVSTHRSPFFQFIAPQLSQLCIGKYWQAIGICMQLEAMKKALFSLFLFYLGN